jgi:hypothetical protein
MKDQMTTLKDLLADRYSDQYARMHEEAHKRGILALGAPSFTWQLGYFVEDNTQAYTSVAETSGVDTFSEATVEVYAKHMFDSIVNAIVERTATAHAAPNIEAAERALMSRGPKSVFLSVDDILVKIIVGDHSDHFTVTITVDLSKNGFKEGELTDTSVIRIDTPSRQFRNAVRGSYASLACRVQETRDKTEYSPEHLEAVTYLKDGIWQDLYSHVLEGSLLLSGDWPVAMSPEPEVFADLRSVILNTERSEWMYGMPQENVKPDLVAAEAPFDSKHMKSKALAGLLPLFEMDDPNLRYRELIACTIFRKRAVYLSPLGSSPFNAKIDARQTPNRPIYFALAVAENNRWQIGRMVRRINNMGCIRLLALRDLDKIKSASDRIRQVGNDLDNRFLNQTTEVKEKERDIEADRQDLAKFKKEIDAIGADIAGHLPYRIYRSQFRSDQFRKQVEDLFVERIEAWQPYDEFVRRRLYPTFEFISRVGQRYDRLNRNYQSQLQALNLELQSVSSSHLVEIQHDILESHSFQHIIETIAFAYYGGYLVYNIGKPLLKPFGKKTYAFLQELPYDWVRQITDYLYDADVFKMAAFMLTTFLSVRRYRRKEKEHKERVEKSRPKTKTVE